MSENKSHDDRHNCRKDREACSPWIMIRVGLHVPTLPVPQYPQYADGDGIHVSNQQHCINADTGHRTVLTSKESIFSATYVGRYGVFWDKSELNRVGNDIKTTLHELSLQLGLLAGSVQPELLYYTLCSMSLSEPTQDSSMRGVWRTWDELA